MAKRQSHERDYAEVFEHYLRLLAADLPAWKREYPFVKEHAGRLPSVTAFYTPGGRRRAYRADVCWPDKGVIVEIDGGQWAHKGGRHNTDADRLKGAAAAILGYRVMHVSTDMLRDDPLGVIAQVRLLVQGV